jgi:RimJ/RimL family protein N-acetyltransferase
MNLAERRRAIRHLLNERQAGDAMAAYYAFHHPDSKTRLVTSPAAASRASGYVCLSRTGIDLFRPLVTLRLPQAEQAPEIDLAAAADLIYQAIPPGTDLFLSSPAAYRPLVTALLAIDQEEALMIFSLSPARFQPIINVLVTRTAAANDFPRFIIRQTTPDGEPGQGEILASASTNWQSPYFAEISVRTQQAYRQQGLGRSVVAALAQEILHSGRTPIYMVADHNQASIRLAESVGFVDTGRREIMVQATLKPRP